MIQVILCLRSNYGYLRLNNVCHRFSINFNIVNLVIVPPGEGATRIGRSFFHSKLCFRYAIWKDWKTYAWVSGPSILYLCSEKGLNVIKKYKVRTVQHHRHFISASMEGHIFFFFFKDKLFIEYSHLVNGFNYKVRQIYGHKLIGK